MIPDLLADDASRGLHKSSTTGYQTNTCPFSGKFEKLVNSEANAGFFIDGPYVTLNLPFAKRTDRVDFFKAFDTEHIPFACHQLAWERLHRQQVAKSTLVTTQDPDMPTFLARLGVSAI